MIIMFFILNFYIFVNDVWRYAFIQLNMQQEATLALEKMIRGVDKNRKGLQESQDVITPALGNSDTQIRFVDSDNPTISRLFYLSGNKLVYEDENLNTTDLIHRNVQSLIFNRPQDDLVKITLNLQRTVWGRDISVALSTSVKLRNN